MSDSGSPEERYAALVERLLEAPEVARPAARGFGSSGLAVDGKVFVMLVTDRLVVKLPRQRVDALVASGDGERFAIGQTRVMREWVSVDPASDQRWLPLATEAMAFVAGKAASSTN